MHRVNQGPWVQPQILAERGPLGPVLDTRAVRTWFLARVRAYLKKGSRLLTRHWVREPLGEGHGRALQSKGILP